MTARRLREWPRAVAAAAVAAVLLIVVGVLVASAASGGHTSRAATASARTAATTITRTVTADGPAAALAAVRARLGRTTAALTSVTAHVHNLLTTAQCWRRKARHPHKTRALHCPLPA